MGILDAPPTIQRPRVLNASALTAFSALLADANNRVVNLGFLGDSLTAGKYANGSTTESNATNERSWREHGVVANLAGLFHTSGRFGGNPGEGVVKLWSSTGTPEDDRITQSTAISGSAPGICQHGNVIPASQSVTFTDTNSATDIDIVYFTPNPSTGYADATYTLDGGAPVALPLATAGQFAKVTLSGLADGPHTLVVTAGAGGTFFLSHFIARRSAVNGVIVHRMGRGGATSDHISGASLSGTTQTNLFKAQFDQQGIDALIVMVGFNDWNTQPTVGSGTITPTVFSANLAAICTYVTGTLGKPVLLVPDPRAQETLHPSAPFSEANYYAQMKALATGLVAFADPAGELLGTWTNANGLGLTADTIHLKQLGHALLARGIFDVLTRLPAAAAVAA